MTAQQIAGRIDPRPVRERTPRPNLLDAAIIRVDGSKPGPDTEEGPRIDPQGGRVSPSAIGPEVDVGRDLRSSADWITNEDGTQVQWTRGFGYRPRVCNGGNILDPFGNVEGTPAAIPTEIDTMPFLVEGTDKVSLFGAATDDIQAERYAYAVDQLLACRSKIIERELWTGAQSVTSGWGNRYLANNAVVLPEGDMLLGHVTALAVLEREIAANVCDQQGMIHCRADTATLWASNYLIYRFGNLLVTANGTLVVPGAGYNGESPATGDPGLDPNHAGVIPSADSAWAYATTVPEVFLSDLLPPQRKIERTTTSSNDLTTYARQMAAVTWGCLQIGVHVSHVTDITTTGS